MLGFEGVDLRTLDIAAAAADPRAALRMHALIRDGHLTEWTYLSWLHQPDGTKQRGIACGHAVTTGPTRRLAVALYPPRTTDQFSAERGSTHPVRVPVLIAHDDDAIRARMCRALAASDLVVDEVSDLVAVRAAAGHLHGFVLVIGARLAGTADVARLVHGGNHHVVVVVGEHDESLATRALDAGVDDYVREETLERDLAVRVRAILRRVSPPTRRTLDFGDLVIDLAAREVRQHDQPIALTAREFDLLAFLASAPHSAFTREELLRQVWRSSPDWQGIATVTEHVRRIREKLQPNGQTPWIRTVRGSGYLFGP
jgi:two-component system phosphate regulon response regulator PhoB